MKELEQIVLECKNELYHYIKSYREIIFKDSKQWNYWNSARQIVAIMNKFWENSNVFKESILHLMSICIYKEFNFDVSFLKAFRKEWMTIDLIRDYFSDWWNRTVSRWFKNILKQFSFKYYFFEKTWNEQLVHNLFMYFIYMKYEEKSKNHEFFFEKQHDSDFFKWFMWILDWEELENEYENKNNEIIVSVEKKKIDNEKIIWNLVSKEEIDFIETKNNERKLKKREESIKNHIENIVNEQWELEDIQHFILLLEWLRDSIYNWKDNEFIRIKMIEIVSKMKNSFKKYFSYENIESYIKKSLIDNKSELWFIWQWWNIEFLINKLVKWINTNDEESLIQSIYLWIYYSIPFDWEFIK